MSLFTDILNSTDPYLFMGDFNWEILHAPNNGFSSLLNPNIPILNCTRQPAGASQATKR